jgi:transposase
MGTRARNHLHSLLHRDAIQAPQGKIFSQKHRAWWHTLNLPPTERMRVRHDLATIDQIDHQLQEIDQDLSRISTTDPWADQVPFLLQLPGFGTIVTMTVLAAIGDISRFHHPKKLVGNSVLGASIHDSGKKHRTGRITIRGRKELCWILVEVARRAVDTHPYWKSQYQRLEPRLGSNKAAVTIARKMLVVVWHLLTKREVDRHAIVDKVAFKYMMWSWKVGKERRSGMNTRQWARYPLMKLGLAEDIDRSARWERLSHRS